MKLKTTPIKFLQNSHTPAEVHIEREEKGTLLNGLTLETYYDRHFPVITRSRFEGVLGAENELTQGIIS